MIKRLLDNDHLLVGISELSEMSDLSPRQLRYWEQKGYIQSVAKDTNTARKYRLPMIAKVEMIKSYLDEGFILAKAVEKAEKKIIELKNIRIVFSEVLQDSKVYDDRFTVVVLGDFEPHHEQLILIHDHKDNKKYYHPINHGQTLTADYIAQVIAQK
jgi:DNA-binding transcriptional MerR regulator